MMQMQQSKRQGKKLQRKKTNDNQTILPTPDAEDYTNQNTDTHARAHTLLFHHSEWMFVRVLPIYIRDFLVDIHQKVHWLLLLALAYLQVILMFSFFMWFIGFLWQSLTRQGL